MLLSAHCKTQHGCAAVCKEIAFAMARNVAACKEVVIVMVN